MEYLSYYCNYLKIKHFWRRDRRLAMTKRKKNIQKLSDLSKSLAPKQLPGAGFTRYNNRQGGDAE